MKKFNFTIHQYKGEDGYQKPEAIARFQMEVIGPDTAYDLADAFQQILPFEGFITSEEVPYVLDMSDPSGTAAVQP